MERREGSKAIDIMRGKVLRAAERRAKAETEHIRAVEWEKALRWDLGLLLREYADEADGYIEGSERKTLLPGNSSDGL
jgi:hypothetical protein